MEKIVDYNKNAQRYFQFASKVDKKIRTKYWRKYFKKGKIKNEKIAEIKKEEKNINNSLFKHHFTTYQNPSDMYKKLRETKSKRNENQVYSIKKILDKIKKT